MFRPTRWWVATAPIPRACTPCLPAPPDRDLDWQEDGVAGVSRFLGRVYRLSVKHAAFAKSGKGQQNRQDALNAGAVKLLRKLHQTIAKITQDFEGRWHFNTDVAAIMEFVNENSGGGRAACGGRDSGFGGI